MKEQKPSYYQYQPELKYQVYVKFEEAEVEAQLAELLGLMGFSKVESDPKNISLNQYETKVLKVAKASPRVAKQIQSLSNGMESYGPESLSSHGNYKLYRYHSVGMMVFEESAYSWEMGLVKAASNLEKIKVMFTRFISWALASKGVVGFWAVPVEQGFVVMKPNESQFESVFVDMDQMALITRDGVQPISADLQILRLDETLKNASKKMKREELLSFLHANTSYFSYLGVAGSMRKSLFEIASFAQGVVYPVENFKPRTDIQADQ